MDYIIVQAGGKGTRLQYLTKNKPKALVPIDNLPMLFHLFRKYPDKRFVVIADYKRVVMKEYLAAFADVKYQVVEAVGTGTCSGVKQAIELIPEKEPEKGWKRAKRGKKRVKKGRLFSIVLKILF